jgi:hypothetical protein
MMLRSGLTGPSIDRKQVDPIDRDEDHNCEISKTVLFKLCKNGSHIMMIKRYERFMLSTFVLCCFVLNVAGSEPSNANPPVRDPKYFTSKTVKSYVELKEQNVVMQTTDYSCGAACLATVMTYYWGHPTTEDEILDDLIRVIELDELVDRIKNGLAIGDLKKLAVYHGYRAALGTLPSVDKLAEVKVPVIVVIKIDDFTHFVVVRKVIGGYVYLADPIRGNLRMTTTDFSEQWVGRGFLVVLDPVLNQSTHNKLYPTAYEMDPTAGSRQTIRRNALRVNLGFK